MKVEIKKFREKIVQKGEKLLNDSLSNLHPQVVNYP